MTIIQIIEDNLIKNKKIQSNKKYYNYFKKCYFTKNYPKLPKIKYQSWQPLFQ